nr:hypothetical protein [Tanacetum cinerariifolium]
MLLVARSTQSNMSLSLTRPFPPPRSRAATQPAPPIADHISAMHHHSHTHYTTRHHHLVTPLSPPPLPTLYTTTTETPTHCLPTPLPSSPTHHSDHPRCHSHSTEHHPTASSNTTETPPPRQQPKQQKGCLFAVVNSQGGFPIFGYYS